MEYDPMVLESQLSRPKTLDPSVLAARAHHMEMQELEPENDLLEKTASGDMEVAEQGVGTEAAPLDLTHNSDHVNMSKHCDAARTQTQAAQVKGKSHGDGAQEIQGVGQKKRKERGRDWIAQETDDLFKAVLKKKDAGTRMDQNTASDSLWNAIAKEVPGRTWVECKGRMDTLKKSYSKIKKYCDRHQKEFAKIPKEAFRDMKLSARLTEEWFSQIRDFCPPRPKMKLRTVGAGSSSKNNTNGFVPCASTSGLEAPSVDDTGTERSEPAFAELSEFVASDWPQTDHTLCIEEPPMDEISMDEEQMDEAPVDDNSPQEFRAPQIVRAQVGTAAEVVLVYVARCAHGSHSHGSFLLPGIQTAQNNIIAGYELQAEDKQERRCFDEPA